MTFACFDFCAWPSNNILLFEQKLKKKAKGDDEDKENAAAATNNVISKQVTTRSKVHNSSNKLSKEATTKKELSGHEARRRIVLEVERGAVSLLCECLTKATLVETVSALGIDCGEGNNPTSRAVVTKRLAEHIAKVHGGVGLPAFLVQLCSPSPRQKKVHGTAADHLSPLS
jgi:hypothetical protein